MLPMPDEATYIEETTTTAVAASENPAIMCRGKKVGSMSCMIMNILVLLNVVFTLLWENNMLC